MRKHWHWLWILPIFAALFSFACDYFVTWHSQNYIYDDLAQVPVMPVALVLGTSKYNTRGGTNLFYRARMDAAAAAFQAGKISGLLVSGDNAKLSYNEPRHMYEDLVQRDIPGEYITLDFAGFRTLDSVIRAKEVFGQQRILIISQRFHIERAVFIARMHHIEAYGFSADDVPWRWHIKVRLREVLARTMAVIDVLLGREPKFLGKLEEVNLKSEPAEPGATTNVLP
jgi:SanA protein